MKNLAVFYLKRIYYAVLIAALSYYGFCGWAFVPEPWAWVSAFGAPVVLYWALQEFGGQL